MCPTVAPLVRGGRGDITGNVPGQCFTSLSPCTHVQGAYGAPTSAVGGTAEGRRREFVANQRYNLRHSHMTKLLCGTPHTPLSATAKLGCMTIAPWYLLFDKVAHKRFSTLCNAYVRMTRATSQQHSPLGCHRWSAAQSKEGQRRRSGACTMGACAFSKNMHVTRKLFQSDLIADS